MDNNYVSGTFSKFIFDTRLFNVVLLLKNNPSRVFFIKVLFGFPWIGDTLSIIVFFFFPLFFLFWSFFLSFNSLIFFTSVDLPFFDVTSINGTTSLIALFGTSSGIITERFFLDFPTSVTASVGEYVNTYRR